MEQIQFFRLIDMHMYIFFFFPAEVRHVFVFSVITHRSWLWLISHSVVVLVFVYSYEISQPMLYWSGYIYIFLYIYLHIHTHCLCICCHLVLYGEWSVFAAVLFHSRHLQDLVFDGVAVKYLLSAGLFYLAAATHWPINGHKIPHWLCDWFTGLCSVNQAEWKVTTDRWRGKPDAPLSLLLMVNSLLAASALLHRRDVDVLVRPYLGWSEFMFIVFGTRAAFFSSTFLPSWHMFDFSASLAPSLYI